MEKHNLVNEFDREAVLAHLSSTLQRENNKKVLRSGLRWAFQLWKQPRSHGRPFRIQTRSLFRVPTLAGEYINARDAVFSADWPTDTAGGLLQRFLDAAPSGLPDLEGLERRRLAAPDDLAFRGRWIEDWALFLSELGVNAGLKPELKGPTRRAFPAWKVTDFSFLKDYHIPNEFADFWRDDISAEDPSLLRLRSSTEYVIDGSLPWMPGQADVEHFSARCKELYAQLVLEWLSTDDPQACWDIQVHHRAHHVSDRRRWPSPVKSFIRSVAWLPVDASPDSSSAHAGIRPCDLWVHESAGERFEPYLRRPSSRLRQYLERAPSELIHKLATLSGLRVFNSRSVLPEQLEYLAEQHNRKDLDRHFERRLLNFYDRTWALFAKQLDVVEDSLDAKVAPSTILVRRGQSLESVLMLGPGRDSDECIYVCDTDRKSDRDLLEASGLPFVFLGEGDPSEVGLLFAALYGDRIRRLSEAEYSLLADGKRMQDSVATGVPSICPRLRTMVAVAMEALTGTEAQRLPTDRSTILTKLDQLTMIKATALSFVIDGVDVSAAREAVSAFHFRLDGGEPVVVIQSDEAWSWTLVDRSIGAICEALGQRSLAPHLRLLVVHLEQDKSQVEAPSQPFEDLTRFSRFLHLPASASQAAGASLSAGLERHAPFIRAVLHLLAGARSR